LLDAGYDVRALACLAPAMALRPVQPAAAEAELAGARAAAAVATATGRAAAVPINMSELVGCTMLQTALETGAGATARLILQAGAPVDGTDIWGWTCLHSAAYGGHVECARLILAAFAALDAADENSGSGRPDGGRRNAKDIYGWTAPDLAAFYGHGEVVALLAAADSAQGGTVAGRYIWERYSMSTPANIRHAAVYEVMAPVEMPN
jgi:ankyrin repeat protein